MSTKYQISNTKYSLTIAWLYPDLMSTYGDRGNIITLQKRCEWRGIKVTIISLSIASSRQQLETSDLLFMGGGEDKQQKIVSEDFQKGKDKVLSDLIEKNIPGLFICGAYQFLGKYYKEADGTVVNGLGILDLHSENSGTKQTRLIGNIAVKMDSIWDMANKETALNDILIGFENHGGRTYLGKKIQPLGKVQMGFGNNGKDQTEGAIYKNAIGTYLHGPILPKNPALADWLITKALEVKYNKKIVLQPLDDSLEEQARKAIAEKLNLTL